MALCNASDRLRLIAGARWTSDELSYFHNRVPTAFSNQPGIRTDSTGFSDRNSSDNTSGRAGIQYDVGDDSMLYASYSRGYKGPAYNVFFNMRADQRNLLEAETADSYEGGIKSTLMDGRVLVNAAVYDAKYENFQANSFIFVNGALVTTLANAGTVSSSGWELDVQARPTNILTLGLGISHNDAKVDKFPVATGGTVQARDGSKLPLAPEWKASLVGELTIPVGSFTLTPNVVLAYQDDSFSDLNEPVKLRIPSYSTVDVSVALTDANDRFRIALIGRNITDESYTVLKTDGGPGGNPGSSVRLQIPRDADRYFGIQARFNFGTK